MGNDFVPCEVCTMQHLDFHVQKSFIIKQVELKYTGEAKAPGKKTL